jgi:hypothetical protein
MNYSLVVDTWLGQGPVDAAKLIAGGVAGGIARLNSCNGVLALDSSFAAAWKGYEALPARGLYFVWHPDYTAQQNFDFLKANAPADCTAFFGDVEIAPLSHDGGFVAAQLAAFVVLFKAWKPNALLAIYTGGWFVPVVNYWPTTLDYWYSRYPYALYPDPNNTGIVMAKTWDWVRSTIDAFDAAQVKLGSSAWNWMLTGSNGANSFKIGPVKLWQAMADHVILPGSDHIIDVNIFPGTVADLKAWFRMPVVLTLEQRVAALEAKALAHGW